MKKLAIIKGVIIMKRLPIRQILCLIFMFHIAAMYGQVEHTAIPIHDFKAQSQGVTEQKSTNQNAYMAGSYLIKPDNEGQLDFDTTLARNLEKAMNYVRNSYNVPGVSAAMLIPGRGMWLGVCGYSTLEPLDSIRPETLIDICSNTKSFISTIMLQLAEEGKLSLDDSIGSYLQNLTEKTPGQITIRQLLNMKSGLWDYADNNDAFWDAFYEDINRFWTLEDIITNLARPPKSAPGTSFQYNNLNLVIAGEIIKKITQTNLSTQLHQRIFEPLALEHTFFPIKDTSIESPENLGPIAHPWKEGKDNFEFTYSNAMLSLCAGAGGIFSTAEDLARWGNALFTGQILTPESLEQMQSLITPSFPDLDGFGLCIYKKKFLGKELWGFDGNDIFGLQSLFNYYTPSGISIAIFLNDWGGALFPIYAFLFSEYLKTLPVLSFTQPGILYMLSSNSHGLLLNANTPTLDLSTLGHVSYTGLKKVKVHPVTGDLWGLASNPVIGNQLVKYDGFTAEAFPRVDISTPETGSLIAMDFTDDGTPYLASLEGKIYTVDIASGIGTLLATSEIPFESMAIQPGTGAIWASAKDVQSTKRRIFKINKETGDTLGVGNTGINQKIKDIAFDTKGNLFGIIGWGMLESIPSQLVKIDTVTGMCTEVKVFDTIAVSSIAFSSGAVLSNREDYITDQSPQCELSQNYPNPFSDFTTINFKISVSDYVRLKIYNVNGQEVATLVNEEMKPGSYNATWNAGGFPEGVYFYRLESGSFVESRKMVLMR